MKFKKNIQRIADAFIHAVFPPKCLACGSFFDPEKKRPKTGFRQKDIFKEKKPYDGASLFRNIMSPFLCPQCRSGFLPVVSPLCPGCGIMFKTSEGFDHLCGECMASPKRIGMARAPGVFSGEYKKVIYSFKYRSKTALAKPLGMALFLFFKNVWRPGEIDAVLPTPLHRTRLRQRGFNQASLLVRNWPGFMRESGFENPGMKILPGALERRKKTAPQTGLDRKKRALNVKNAFFLTDHSSVRGKRLLVVDDVYTTGATVGECAKVLLKGGAASVDALALARAPRFF